jgi:hypothetical protein
VALVVHDPAHRRIRPGGDLDEVEARLAGGGEGLGQRSDPELLPVLADQPDLAGPDAVVDPGLVCGYVITSLVGTTSPRPASPHATMADAGSIRHLDGHPETRPGHGGRLG